MLYNFNNKFYILVSGYFKEVDIEKKGDEYTVKAKKDVKKIEASTVKNFTTVEVKKAYELSNKVKSSL